MKSSAIFNIGIMFILLYFIAMLIALFQNYRSRTYKKEQGYSEIYLKKNRIMLNAFLVISLLLLIVIFYEAEFDFGNMTPQTTIVILAGIMSIINMAMPWFTQKDRLIYGEKEIILAIDDLIRLSTKSIFNINYNPKKKKIILRGDKVFSFKRDSISKEELTSLIQLIQQESKSKELIIDNSLRKELTLTN